MARTRSFDQPTGTIGATTLQNLGAETSGAGEPHGSASGRRRRACGRGVVGFALTAAILAVQPVQASYAAFSTVAIAVDFTTTIAATPADHIGFTATEFGVEGGPVPRSAADQTALKALGAGAVRIQLTSDGKGGVVGGSGGGDKSLTGDQWLDSYEAMGLEPTVIVDLDQTDALAVQTYLRTNGHQVRRYIVGNEMDANSSSAVSQDTYVQRFGDVAAALRSTDPTVEVGGPAVACWDCLGQQFVQKLAGLSGVRRPSFVDWHEYGSGDGQSASMTTSYRYAGELATLKSWLPADGSIGIEVGEFNMNWGNETGNNSMKQSVWDAAALGTILTAGATAFQYGDKNNALGLVDAGRPKASYWGLAMFTGYDTFRPFGSTATATSSSDGTVRVFASTGAKNVVVVNTSTTAKASRISLKGYAGSTAQRWVLHGDKPYRTPDDKAVTNNVVNLWLPAMSVQTLVLQ